MKPEAQARLKIDQILTNAGWVVQDYDQINLGAGLGIVVREYPLKSGYADYLLFINRKAVGVIEAKPAGFALSGVEIQSDKYSFNLPKSLPCQQMLLPFIYESTGTETFFRDSRDPDYRSRRVFTFHKPETLQEWLGKSDTLRGLLQLLPTIETEDLRGCQQEAIAGLFNSLKENRPRALIQMATGVGKTYTAVSFIYAQRNSIVGKISKVIKIDDLKSALKGTYLTLSAPVGGSKTVRLKATLDELDDLGEETDPLLNPVLKDLLKNQDKSRISFKFRGNKYSFAITKSGGLTFMQYAPEEVVTYVLSKINKL